MPAAIATETGHQRVEGVGVVYTYRLTPGEAFQLTGMEWRLAKLLACDLRSVEYTYRIIWIQGRACAVFSVLGSDKWAQPINGNVAPGVVKRERAAAKAARSVEEAPRQPTITVESRALAHLTEATASLSKAALKLAKMKARRGES
jgi:hypothetical protein